MAPTGLGDVQDAAAVRAGMALAPWRPFGELSTLHRGIDDLFARFFGEEERGWLRPFDMGTMPAIESFVRGDELIVRADLPGIDPKNVELAVEGDRLMIKGERKKVDEEKRAPSDAATFDTPWGLPWPLREVRERVRLQKRVVDPDCIQLSREQVRGDLLRDEGAWTLVRHGAWDTEVRYAATFQLHRWLPELLVRTLERRSAPKLTLNLQSYATKVEGKSGAS